MSRGSARVALSARARVTCPLRAAPDLATLWRDAPADGIRDDELRSSSPIESVIRAGPPPSGSNGSRDGPVQRYLALIRKLRDDPGESAQA